MLLAWRDLIALIEPDWMLLMFAITTMVSSMLGYAIILSDQRLLVNPHWNQGVSIGRIGLHWLPKNVITTSCSLVVWLQG